MKYTCACLLLMVTLCSVAFIYEEGGDLRITYKLTFNSKCVALENANMLARLVSIDLRHCVKECGLRQNCMGLMYHRQFRLCELVRQVGQNEPKTGHCVFIPASNIIVEQTPCGECIDNQACDLETKQCSNKECLFNRSSEVTIFGNMNQIGNKVVYICKGIRMESRCHGNGLWEPPHTCTLEYINIALGKYATMPSEHTYPGTDNPNPYPASKGVDGNVSTFFHTLLETNPWWLLDLGSSQPIRNITVYNRETPHDNILARANYLWLYLGNTEATMVPYGNVDIMPEVHHFHLPDDTYARFVKLQIHADTFFHLGEVEVIGIKDYAYLNHGT